MAAYTAVFMTHLICRLTAKNRDQLRNPTLGNRVWAYLYLTLLARQGTANRKRSLIFATALFQLHTGLSSIPVMPVVLSNGDTKHVTGSKQGQHTSLLSTTAELSVLYKTTANRAIVDMMQTLRVDRQTHAHYMLCILCHVFYCDVSGSLVLLLLIN